MNYNISEAIKCAAGAVKAQLVLKNAGFLNVFTNQFEIGDIAVHNGQIVGIGEYIGECELDMSGKTVVPGFIDAHIHLESSVVSPAKFIAAAAAHGTSAVITDPHEIANVLGEAGLEYMMQSTEKLPADVYFMLPSCVPASPFDENGATLGAEFIEKNIDNPRVLGLAEMMNYPGVLAADNEIIKKIEITLSRGKAIDGHAPMLNGKQLNAYVAAHIKTDHECISYNEAYEKLKNGQWILIREGTAGKNLSALLPLLNSPCAARCLLCCDDKHCSDINETGHIDNIIRRAIAGGADVISTYKAASYNAAVCYSLHGTGAIAPGYKADFAVLDDVRSCKINSVFKNGININEIKLNAAAAPKSVCNTVNIGKITPESFVLRKEKEKIIKLIPGEILTSDGGFASKISIDDDIIKVAVVERHHGTGHIGIAFVKGYGLKCGAVATSIAHDSHNIIAVGTTDADIFAAVTAISEMHGGMVVTKNGITTEALPLPIAGLMCDMEISELSRRLDALKAQAHSQGVNRDIDPFMTLSFVSLPVIPKLKLTTLGVVDVEQFKLI